MEGLTCESCQIGGVETQADKETEALEEHNLHSETWSNSNKAKGPVHSSETDSAISVPFSEPLLGLILKVPELPCSLCSLAVVQSCCLSKCN